ncbi:STM4012 family radical SAM protein [Flammeovirga aprica]|uniref:Coproporphyrinogen III oxidase family protein n=1 Tax=Flammeovirga aprica JL-4 TaxID=694437 RepID=A0A7X9XAB5_9BACT|nr:STM4012 family radical SAM protein [Flammeovirga aprica]NME69449.1 coproporphyrinogen III oxidase family protein [Flammeovirga aprica JL-4]
MNLNEYINQSYYHSYAYSYPHKMAYRTFDKPLTLKDVWKEESKRNVFLYLHLPFCEMRCGFCNLFTIANPKSDMHQAFLSAFSRQVKAIKEELGDIHFANFAFGGGTPSYLSADELNVVLSTLNSSLALNTHTVNSAIEVSPKTITSDKIQLLKENGFFRVSMGVQSFIEEEVKAMGRPQKVEEVTRAIRDLKEANFPLLNLDLIYGTENQTSESWQYTLDQMLEVNPEEVFLYPLYVRPLTGLGLKEKEWDDFRMKLYLQARDFLMENGYEQVTMRQFKRKDAPSFAHKDYKSQENAMLSLGVGARSYTKKLHYSSDYAVGRSSIKNIINHYNTSSKEDFKKINYGIQLNLEEEKRRYFIKSFCEGTGLSIKAYQNYFHSSVFEDFKSEIDEMNALQLIDITSTSIKLNLKGRTLEDVIGPWLYSDAIKASIQKFELV